MPHFFDPMREGLAAQDKRIRAFFIEQKQEIDSRNHSLLRQMLPLYAAVLLLCALFLPGTAAQRTVLWAAFGVHLVFSAVAAWLLHRFGWRHVPILCALTAFGAEIITAAALYDGLGQNPYGVLVFPLIMILLQQVYMLPPVMALGGVIFNAALFLLVGVAGKSEAIAARGMTEMCMAAGLALVLYATSLYNHVVSYEEQKRLHYLCIHDPLTGVFNLSAFEQEYQKSYAGRLHLFAMMDMDNFKGINDTHGHTVGDQVLMVFSAALKEQAQKQFSESLVGRFGGDEFLIAAAGFSNLEDMTQALENLQQNVCARMEQSFSRPIGFSMGVVVCSEHDSFREVFGRADREMYRAKAKGRHLPRDPDLAPLPRESDG